MNMVGGRRRRQVLDDQLSKLWCKFVSFGQNTLENIILQKFLSFTMAEMMNLTGKQTVKILKSCDIDKVSID